jgi:DNA polymerase elongation subunit (family B)
MSITRVYGDTDSLFGTGVDPFNEKKMEFIGEYISSHMKEFTDKYNVHDNKFKMRIEKSADAFLMLDKKKCYIMHAVKEYKETLTGGKWKDLDEWEVTGFEKSDISELSNRNFVEMLKMICKAKRDKSIDVFREIHVGLKKWKVELRSKLVPLLDLCPTVAPSKPFNQYGRPNKDGKIGSIPIYVRAAVYSNANLGTNFYPGDKIPYLYVRGKTDVIAVPEEWNYDDLEEAGYSVDYDTMYKKQVLVKMDLVCKMLGFKVKEVLSGARQIRLDSYGSVH